MGRLFSAVVPIRVLQGFFMIATGHLLSAQVSDPLWKEQDVATNVETVSSYEKQLLDFQKKETARTLVQREFQYTRELQRKLKENEENQKLTRLQLEEQDILQQKQELEQKELRDEIQQRMLLNYIRKLHKESLARAKKDSAEEIGKTKESGDKISGEASPMPTPDQQKRPLEETIKSQATN